MTDTKKSSQGSDLSDKKIDIFVYSIVFAMVLSCAISFCRDIKTDPHPFAIRALIAICGVGAIISEIALFRAVKNYRKAKREISDRTNTNQK